MMGISRGETSPPLTLSALGEACSRNDLTAVHEILVKTGYKDDEGTDNEVMPRSVKVALVFYSVEIYGIALMYSNPVRIFASRQLKVILCKMAAKISVKVIDLLVLYATYKIYPNGWKTDL